ncbi:MAG TPA: hypothetical protein VM053_03650 [Gemmatimonadaceae bacterium]|nr:hypothetical protein [Gemmatimonadaceae bacterium]
MKHKGERHIPDFSSKKPKAKNPLAPDGGVAATTPHVKPPQTKPQNTSVKSGGRRGA